MELQYQQLRFAEGPFLLLLALWREILQDLLCTLFQALLILFRIAARIESLSSLSAPDQLVGSRIEEIHHQCSYIDGRRSNRTRAAPTVAAVAAAPRIELLLSVDAHLISDMQIRIGAYRRSEALLRELGIDGRPDLVVDELIGIGGVGQRDPLVSMVFGKVGRLVEVIRNILSQHQATEANQTSQYDPQTAFHGRYSPKFHFDFACAILIGSPVHQTTASADMP